MSKRAVKTTLIALAAVLAAVLLLVGSYLLYVVLSYYRVEDSLALKVDGTAESVARPDTEMSLVTYNIGFGAYSPDYSFFMDGGEHSRALSREAVLQNTDGAISVINKENPDFVLLQEVDQSGTRSYRVDQTEMIAGGLKAYDRVFAQNYDSAYLAYPFFEPIGANKSGMMTFSRFNITESVRKSLPVEESFYKFLDLDRAYTVSQIEVEGGRRLMLYNVHLSAYTSDGSIADEQLKMLAKDMQAQYEKGNWVVAAGDFNKDMLGDSSRYFKRSEGEFTWAKPLNTALLTESLRAYTGQNAPTCRNADSPFRGDGTDFVLSVDGVLASNNVEVLSCETLDIGFSYSDHNPVKLLFKLKTN